MLTTLLRYSVKCSVHVSGIYVREGEGRLGCSWLGKAWVSFWGVQAWPQAVGSPGSSLLVQAWWRHDAEVMEGGEERNAQMPGRSPGGARARRPRGAEGTETELPSHERGQFIRMEGLEGKKERSKVLRFLRLGGKETARGHLAN